MNCQDVWGRKQDADGENEGKGMWAGLCAALRSREGRVRDTRGTVMKAELEEESRVLPALGAG